MRSGDVIKRSVLCPLISLVILALPLSAAEPETSPSPFALEGVILTNDRWPDATDIESFARSIFRIERTRSEGEEAEVLFRWMQKCTLSGPPAYEVWPKNRYTHDAGKIIFVHGYSTCDGLGATLAQVWRALGRRSHRTYIPARGHTIAELEYRDEDGVARWHIFDTHGHWYGRTPEGRVSSALDIAAKPDQVPLRGTWSGYSMTGALHSWTPGTSRQNSKLSLLPAEKAELLWDGGGRFYFRPGTIDSENRKVFFEEGSLFRKTVGAARFVYAPKVTAASPVSLEYRFSSPYIYTAGSVELGAECADDTGRVAVSVRFGANKKWALLAEKKGKGIHAIRSDLAAEGNTNIRGRYEFDLRIELESGSKDGAKLTSLSVERWGQLNRRVLPHICLGWNTFTLKADRVADGYAPKATVSWLGRGGEEFESRATAKTPHRFTVFGARRRHEEPPIVMKSVTIECVPAPKEQVVVERGAKGVTESSNAEKLLAIARTENAGAFDTLRGELASEDNDVRYWAVHALGELGDARALEHIAKLLRTDPSEKVRLSCANALGMLKTKEAVPVLIEALEKKTYSGLAQGKENRLPFGWMLPVRWQAARSLAAIGDPHAVEPMIAQLKKAKSSDTDFIVFLADALAALEAREAIPVLRDKAVTKAAGSAGGRACVQALIALARRDDEDVNETIQALIKALDSRETDIRAEAAAGLGALRARPAADALKHLLTKEKEVLVRNAAVEALKEIDKQ